ncbi:hypothetical protein [Nocardioides bruguierae]|uniref:hypothetical protein n=1 Tax=Nocardioides bruguierae TaxID=2945102 RepID=UPI0020222DBF|nr:hypothetical protein [Nocardioides bruguierae]MCL8024275.1 hypothetical protein [Nocardioides bruguierae]
MTRHRGVAGAVGVAGAAVTLALLLSGCAGDPTQEYCDTVTDGQEQLAAAVDAGSPTALVDALPALERLRDASPDDVADDWQYLTGRVVALDDALEDALDGTDLTAQDLVGLDEDEVPAGVEEADLVAVRAAAGELASTQTQQALATVTAEVRAVCGTSLTGG